VPNFGAILHGHLRTVFLPVVYPGGFGADAAVVFSSITATPVSHEFRQGLRLATMTASFGRPKDARFVVVAPPFSIFVDVTSERAGLVLPWTTAL
jgi:hypothetical protein